MATRRYKLSPGQTEFQVIEEAGIATVSNVVELTIDLGAAITDGNAPGATRFIKKEEALMALEMFENWILTHDWLGS
jgi:hypothetical protein